VKDRREWWPMVSTREDEEFDAFMTASWPSLYRTAVLMTSDAQLAEDLLQNTMGKVYKSWRRVSRVEHPRSYARTILANEVSTWWRRRSSSELPVETWPEATSISGLDDQIVDADLMWQALSTLPARQRAVVVLRYYEDLSGAEIAAVLGISEGAVKSHTHRALRTLETALTAGAGNERGPLA
jgi:RNA polymerase sigma-70 factor (ECF subfamily)